MEGVQVTARRMTFEEALDFMEEHNDELMEMLGPDLVFGVWPELGNYLNGQLGLSGFPVIVVKSRNT